MSNSYFQFKQFRVEQDRCAMKVTTDACIQGAWTPVLPSVKNVLDVGTGTGILALMLAQKNSEITVDAIEVDKDAAGQARANVAGSPWRERINILEGDVRNYPFDKRYDLIITNPPFFSNSLLGDDVNKNLARHLWISLRLHWCLLHYKHKNVEKTKLLWHSCPTKKSGRQAASSLLNQKK